MSISRAVYTNLGVQGILEHCQEQNKCVFWHTGYCCECRCLKLLPLVCVVINASVDLFSYMVKMAEISVWGINAIK